MKRRLLIPALLMPAAACGAQEDAEPPKNEASRLTEQIQKQGEQIARQADEGAAAIEQALENESAGVFENRATLLNETADGAAAPRQ
jgi:hypothetical protein